jgi:hypothetical protein
MPKDTGKDRNLVADYFAEQVAEVTGDAAPPSNQPPPPVVEFEPNLNPRQRVVYGSTSRFILAYGERGSGKTVAAIHKLVKHCYENSNALAIIITGVRRQAEEGGAWHKLVYMVLPQWGRAVDTRKGQLIDDNNPNTNPTTYYTLPLTNTSKDIFLWIRCKDGYSWSKVLLLSMPVEGFISDRFRGPEASYLLVDEAQTLSTDSYFKILIQQLGRRPGIALQQAVYCCNPAGPSHWLYKRFFVNPVEHGTWDEDYCVVHVPIKENIHNLPNGYYENVLEACRGDEIEYRRMVLGEWIDAPDSDSLFCDQFSSDRHVKGNAVHNEGIMPIPGTPIIIGWDPGATSTSIIFQQLWITKDRRVWVVFDELGFVDQYVSFHKLAPLVVDRCVYWAKRVGYDFKFVHISDSSAFNQFRAKDGSFDSQAIEERAASYVESSGLPDRYKIKLLEAPKGNHSVEARVRGTKERLELGEILVSATCLQAVAMFSKITEDPENRMRPHPRSRYRHCFDALSYPHIYYESRRGFPQASAVKPMVYTVGT